MKEFIVKVLATGTYVGYIPFASGTWGTLWGIPVFYLLSGLAPLIWGTLIVISTIIAIYISDEAERIFKKKDSSFIVIDEIVGYMAATFMLDFTLENVIITFLIFRFFDILKPYPASWIDKELGGGRGVVLDDTVSGIYSNLVSRGVILLLPPSFHIMS